MCVVFRQKSDESYGRILDVGLAELGALLADFARCAFGVSHAFTKSTIKILFILESLL